MNFLENQQVEVSTFKAVLKMFQQAESTYYLFLLFAQHWMLEVRFFPSRIFFWREKGKGVRNDAFIHSNIFEEEGTVKN